MSKTLKHDLIYHLILFILVVMTLYPLFLMFFTSFKNNEQFMQNFWSPTLPAHPTNYIDAWNAVSPYVFNTVLVAVISVGFGLLFASLSAYAFARLNFRFKNFLFIALLALLMIPGLLTLIPQFVEIKAMGLFDTYSAMVLPYISGMQAFAIYVIRSFFESQPKELFEAARIDGATEIRAYGSVAIPLAMPILGTLAIMNLLNVWNDYLWPMISVSSPARWTISVGLLNFKGQYSTQMFYGPLFAGYVLASLPLIILFIFCMNYFIEGMTSGAIKM